MPKSRQELARRRRLTADTESPPPAADTIPDLPSNIPPEIAAVIPVLERVGDYIDARPELREAVQRIVLAPTVEDARTIVDAVAQSGIAGIDELDDGVDHMLRVIDAFGSAVAQAKADARAAQGGVS